MPTNNFKLFDQNKANLLSDTEYANATQRLNGVQTGVASSQLQNKFAYQVSLVAYAIAQIMNQNGLDASDTLAVSAFVGNLGGSLLQKVADKASTAEAAAGVLTNKYISPATMKAAALLLSGGVMSGTLDMNNNKITNLPTPTSSSEPATKGYVDGSFGHKVLSESITLNISSGHQASKNLTKEINLNEIDVLGVRLTFNSDFNLTRTASQTSVSFYLGSFRLLYKSFSSVSSGIIFSKGIKPFSFINFSLSRDDKLNHLNLIPGTDDCLNWKESGNFSLKTSDSFEISGSSSIIFSVNVTLDIYKIYF